MRPAVSTPSQWSYPLAFDPQIFGMVLVSNCPGPGVRNQAGADPGRECRIASGPRSLTSSEDWGSERAGAAEFPAAAIRGVEQRVALVVGMRNDEREPVAGAGLRAGSRVSLGIGHFLGIRTISDRR